MEVTVKDLQFSIEGKTILDRINLHAGSHGMVGILGPNGSGKTSLLRHLYREYKAPGKVFFDQQDIAGFTYKELARQVAVLTQQMELVDQSLTAEEIVSMGRYPYKSLFQHYDPEDQEAVNRIMAENGLADLYGRTLGTMSGGEVQRTMLAKALAQQTDLLILDEPTNHLDVKYRVELMDMLKRFPGLVLITLHDLNLAANYCDYLYVLKDGQICGEGAPKEVCTAEFLSEVFEVPFRVLHAPETIIYVQQTVHHA